MTYPGTAIFIEKDGKAQEEVSTEGADATLISYIIRQMVDNVGEVEIRVRLKSEPLGFQKARVEVQEQNDAWTKNWPPVQTMSERKREELSSPSTNGINPILEDRPPSF